MSVLPSDWSALCALAFLLGIRHGFDADHLATIDGLTRLNREEGRNFGAWCGALFSLGHGGVVVIVALAIAAAGEQWHPPEWVDRVGAAISLAALLLLGILNLRAVLRSAPGKIARPVGIKGRLLATFTQARSKWGVAGIGALFALSFDTLSQSALFAATATQFGGLHQVLLLPVLFTTGMLVTDAVNGWWIGRLIKRADRAAVIASKAMGLAVAFVSLLIAALGIARIVSPSVEPWAEGNGLAISFSVPAMVLLAYLFAIALARRETRITS